MSREPETSKSYGSNLAGSGMPAAIHNETPARIILKGNHGNVLTLAPLETTRPILPETLKEFDLRLPLQRNLLRYVATEPKGRFENVFGSLIGAGFWFVILGVIFTVFKKPSWLGLYWGIGSIVFCIAVLLARLIAKRLAKTVVQIVTQSLTVTFMFVFGIGMPVATLYLFSDRCELFKSHPHFPLLLQGRALQLVFVLSASVLPGLLYFLFDRQCLTTLRRRFEQSIFRLDPGATTLTDVRAKYGKQMEEVYGKEDARAGHKRLNPSGTSLPILAATIFITLGWVITLPPVGEIDVTKPGDLLALFNPQASALTFGFLGAYFFAVTDILRRYVRRDLKPKAYSAVCVRILIVAILAWVISGLPKVVDNNMGKTSSLALALIFLVGIFPETGLTYIRESVRPLTRELFSLTEERGPLTNLDGVDIYDRTRLLDEGITNIEALAHHDFVDLMMETRIPVARLVDWVDQSILHLHATDAERKRLRKYGIRTATDLLQVYKLSQGHQLDDVLRALAGEPDKSKVSRLKIVIEALSDDEWLGCIQHWRANPPVKQITVMAKRGKLVEPAIAKDADTDILALNEAKPEYAKLKLIWRNSANSPLRQEQTEVVGK